MTPLGQSEQTDDPAVPRRLDGLPASLMQEVRLRETTPLTPVERAPRVAGL